jgi:Cu-processing system ATP-binding protein
MQHPAIDMQQVDKRYGKIHALREMSLVLQPGEVLGLFGHNGAGKSTIMKLVLGLIAPSSGSVRTLGRVPTGAGSQEYRRQFGYLPENVSFYDQLTGREVLLFFARLKGYGSKEVDRLLLEVGLAEAGKRAVKTYSKGMRQRLGLAQALLGEPKLLLFDEPTVGLDPIATRDFYSMVDRLRGKGCAVVLCSHVLSGVESHIDRMMIVAKGQKVVAGTIDEVRKAANLPVEVRAKDGAGEQRLFHLPEAGKMELLRQLAVQEGVVDLSIHQPSLSDIYNHFNQQDRAHA